MALVINRMIDLYYNLSELKDHRLDYLPFTSAHSVLLLVGAYLYFVLNFGPKFMKHRKPFNIDKLLLYYNVVQVVLNFSLFAYTILACLYTRDRSLNWFCEPIDLTETYDAVLAAKLSYCYMALKILDLFDTVFFVLRKKGNQISFLHVYHHVAVLLASFIGICFAPGGHAWFFGLLNCFVHVIMYGYYFGSVYSPALKQNLWVKKSITQLQIIQFILSIIHMTRPIIMDDCDYPKSILVIGVSQNFTMLLLFSDFYYKAYIKNNKRKLPGKEC